MNKLIVYTTILFSTLLGGCQDEEEFKLPTDVGFQVDINRNVSTNSRLNFRQGSIRLASFTFDGRREEGDDVYFEKEYEQGLHVPFDPVQAVEALRFQVPQGNYTRLEVELELYDDLEDSGLVVEGTYLNSNGVLYPLRIELGSSLAFEMPAKELSGNTQIVLRANTPANAIIRLDPVKWFETIPLSYLDQALLQEVEQEEDSEIELPNYILINEDTNEHIYAIILNRIEQSSETIFQ
ncbi:hypothetical protein [Cesiribacter sp. SM1]|uniref:hypothetical protein n=1 Tax=Cesiribacter sp. SM1 TaxID=2861196 RepID=UPI001CD3F03E|nr:hypothetical protein [Cesiribacter sp. SM1]